jgi:hypothetical protein
MLMPNDEYAYGCCGVFCEMCPMGNGKLIQLASDLLKLIEGEYKWAKDTVNFSFDDLHEGLRWLIDSSCPTCFKIENPWCDVMKCEKAKKLRSCLKCEEFLTCSSTAYQRDRYPFVLEHYERVKKVGFKKHLEEERKRARSGVSLNDIRKW